MINRKKQIFKIGDIVSPFKDVKTSNQWNVTKIKKAKVIQVNDNYYGRSAQEIKLSILDGSVPGGSNQAWVFSDSIKKCNYIESYEIF